MVCIQEITCRKCLATIPNTNFKTVDEFTKAVLDVPLLNMKLEEGSKHIVCNICYESLNAAVEFKSTCLNSNNMIISYGDCNKMIQIDLREVYVKEKRNERLTEISDDQKVCWLCMQLVTDQFRSVCDEELDAIRMFLPEMNTSIVKDPVICATCFDSLCTHNDFLKDCSKVENKIEGICANQATGDQPEAWPINFLIKTENLQEFETNEREMSIQFEYVNVELEGAQESEIVKHESVKDIGSHDVLENDLQAQNTIHASTSNSDKCNDTTRNFTTHCLRQNNLEVHKTKNRRKIVHKNESDEHTFKCNDCSFQSRDKRGLRSHVKEHRNNLNARVFQCDICSYESKCKANVTRHQLKHKNPSEIQLYKCNDCEYETIYKSLLRAHVLVHMNLPEIWMHKCDECSYMTWKKSHLQSHQLMHKSRSEMQMYKCDLCSYETRYKTRVAHHKLTHKTPAERLKHNVSVKKQTTRRRYCRKQHSNDDVVRKSKVLRMSITQKMKSILNVTK